MADKKKCKECGAPLEGLLFSTIGKLFGIKESENAPGYCNKCKTDSEEKKSEEVDENEGEDELIEDTEESVDEETDSEDTKKE